MEITKVVAIDPVTVEVTLTETETGYSLHQDKFTFTFEGDRIVFIDHDYEEDIDLAGYQEGCFSDWDERLCTAAIHCQFFNEQREGVWG